MSANSVIVTFLPHGLFTRHSMNDSIQCSLVLLPAPVENPLPSRLQYCVFPMSGSNYRTTHASHPLPPMLFGYVSLIPGTSRSRAAGDLHVRLARIGTSTAKTDDLTSSALWPETHMS